MPRYIFPAGAVTVTDGRPRALQFFRSPTATRPQTDLKRVESEYDTTPIANGVITTDESGNYPEFAGPDDLTSLWMQVVSGSGGRTKLDSTTAVSFSGPFAPLAALDAYLLEASARVDYQAASVPNLDLTPGVDNTTAILAARAQAASRNVPLLIPPGTWKMTDNLALWNGARLILQGTLDIFTDHSAAGRGIVGTAVEDVVIEGGGAVAQSNATGRHGVYGMITLLTSGGTGSGNVHVRNIRVLGGESAAVFTAKLDTFSLHNLSIKDLWADGIHLSRGTCKGTVTGITAKNLGDDALALVGITSESGGSVTWPQMTDIVIGDCVVTDFSSSFGSGVAIVGARRVAVSNVTVKDPAAHGVNCQSSPGIGAPAPQDVQITGVCVDSAGGQGFLIGDSTDVTITGGTARNGADSGIALLGSTRTYVTGTKARSNAGFGVYESSGTGNAVTACDIGGNTAGASQVASAVLTACKTT